MGTIAEDVASLHTREALVQSPTWRVAGWPMRSGTGVLFTSTPCWLCSPPCAMLAGTRPGPWPLLGARPANKPHPGTHAPASTPGHSGVSAGVGAVLASSHSSSHLCASRVALPDAQLLIIPGSGLSRLIRKGLQHFDPPPPDAFINPKLLL